MNKYAEYLKYIINISLSSLNHYTLIVDYSEDNFILNKLKNILEEDGGFAIWEDKSQRDYWRKWYGNGRDGRPKGIARLSKVEQ